MSSKFRNRYDISSIKEYALSQGYSCLSESYETSRAKMEWVCPQGHRYYAAWRKFLSGQRCAKCYGNKKLTLAEVQLGFQKEGYLLVSDHYEECMQILDTRCSNGHPYKTSWNNFQQGYRCPECAGNKKPEIDDIRLRLLESGYTLLSEEYENKRSFLMVKCDQGHQYEATWDTINSGCVCPECNYFRKWKDEEIHELADQLGFEYKGQIQKFQDLRKYLFHCTKKHEYWATPYSLQRYPNCPRCDVVVAEQEIAHFLESKKIEFEFRTRSVIKNRELDFFIPSLNLAIEYCGLYWHNEDHKPRNYHLEKLLMCKEKGISLITIFEDEWIHRRNQVYNFLESKLGKTARIRASDCKVLPVCPTKAGEFLDKHHILGRTNTKQKFYGLYYRTELVNIVAYGPHHRDEKRIVLSRVCTRRGLNVYGGLTRLVKAIMKECGITRIATFCDRRWSEGSSYSKVGFKVESVLPPDYSYLKGQKRYSKQTMRLKPGERGPEKSLRLAQGYKRIWDCGKIRYVFEKSQ